MQICVLSEHPLKQTLLFSKEYFHQSPAINLIHKLIFVLLPSFGQRNCVVWWNWGKHVIQTVHFSPRGVFLSSPLCITEELPNSSQVQKWQKQGQNRIKKPKPCFSSPAPRMMSEADREPYLL